MTDTPHTPTPWARVVTGMTHDTMGYDAKGGAFVLAPDNETVLARFPQEAEGHRAFVAVNAHDDLVKAAGLGEAIAALTIAFIGKVCEGGNDWHDAGNKLNDEILRFRRANNTALAKAGGAG